MRTECQDRPQFGLLYEKNLTSRVAWHKTGLGVMWLFKPSLGGSATKSKQFYRYPYAISERMRAYDHDIQQEGLRVRCRFRIPTGITRRLFSCGILMYCCRRGEVRLRALLRASNIGVPSPTQY